jgi:hypothetical protein
MKKWIVLLLALLLAIGAYVAAGPYLTVRAIRTAITQEDPAALSKQVDFPALRSSLKLQVRDRMVREAGPDLQANPFAAFGLAIAGGVTDGAVDVMVTPLGLGALMEGREIWKRFDDGLSSPTTAPAPQREPLHDAKYRYESTSRFTATVKDENGKPVVFVITREGLRWKLSDIRLPM